MNAILRLLPEWAWTYCSSQTEEISNLIPINTVHPQSSGAACSVNISGDSLCVTYRENEKKCISLGNRMSEDKWQHLYVTSSRLFNLFPVEPFASVINRHNKSPAVTLLLSWWTLRGMTPVWPLHLLAPTAQHISRMGFTRNHLQCE